MARSLHDLLAEALVGVQARRILDIGCGEGALGVTLPPRLRSRLVGLDASGVMLRANPPPVAQADATALPFLADAFDAAVAVNVLDHLAEPTVAIGEAHRVLARGGILIAATASRHDSPELAEVWQPPPSSFDAEDGPRLVASVFGQVRVERWDAPLVRLPDTGAVRDYLIARFVAPEVAAAAAERVAAPLAITASRWRWCSPSGPWSAWLRRCSLGSANAISSSSSQPTSWMGSSGSLRRGT